QDGRPLSLGALRGVPMVASSPVRHEGSASPQPLEVHAYQPPWKALAEYAMHPQDVDPSTPHFQHLVNQMHGYDTGDPGGHCLGGVIPLSVPGAYLCPDDGLGSSPETAGSSPEPKAGTTAAMTSGGHPVSVQTHLPLALLPSPARTRDVPGGQGMGHEKEFTTALEPIGQDPQKTS
ncbi:unnamed protein product, partial [Ixodes pacificus]